ncbi:DoxX family protein [Mucilaginibacter sp. BT774]|uniref:DoxX family protein n=1 Tax=Mucilaginibacter sp. BT774 TaxID=3062276 RepID=UPI002675F80E|nr:DoxX family protein [Mucilaginibacter sp. BT774]MDO3627884.1 DoxX family protein [Mucilaginibacter sp. BT774]
MRKNPGRTYLMARLPIAVSALGHGLDRIPKVQVFSDHLVSQFSKTILPLKLVSIFSITLPFIELGVGILLILGLFTRFACIVGLITMLALILGSCLIEQWDNVLSQMLYSLYFVMLYYYAFYNRYSFDRLLGRIPNAKTHVL